MKLDGLRVVDLSVFLPGPYLSMVLADHGAEVVKVEQPREGDPGRHIGVSDGPHTVFFRNLNRGKKSLVLNLKSTEGRAAVLELAGKADVFLESFRPGVAKRLGVDYASLREFNPGIVYCSLTGFGQDGPYRDRPIHDLGVEAVSGMLSINLGSDGQPAIPALPLADLLAGLHGLGGVLMALLRRQATGQGDYIDISMLDCMLSAQRNVVGPTFAEGRQPNPQHERTTGGSAFYRIYRTGDGSHIALAGQEPKFVRSLLGALNRPDLIDLCLSGPGAHQKPVIDFLDEAFRQGTREGWAQRLTQLEVCFGVVNSLPEAFEDPQVLARGMHVHDHDGRSHIANPIRFLNEPSVLDLDSPALDQHRDLLKELS
ncbi:CoA transferase [Luteimonas sp. BDR2-5]|uniref:CaiB/BaiF CoA transferase family protein n=1 Tax=Proluteimonas luteida TaxID=2878685 RepID=UPI001E3E06E8|nr:CoA transferase [Luteimonas sp. BDR2-5]MCD9029733.1 CoA transferase [Luteimonas sp. BDR2-5]